MRDTIVFWIFMILNAIVLIGGGAIFYAIEKYPWPCDVTAATKAFLAQFPVLSAGNGDASQPLIGSFYQADTRRALLDAFAAVTSCRTSFVTVQVSFSDAIYYADTIMTTTGYGHVLVRTLAGKWVTVIYCYIAIPIFFFTCYLLGKRITLLTNRVVGMVRLAGHPRFGVFVKLFILIVMGQIIFFFIPAGFLVALEQPNKWSYLDAYYCLSNTFGTIGLGDFTPARTVTATWMEVYRVAVYVFTLFGVAYLGHVIRFLVESTRKTGPTIEKRVARIAHNIHLPHLGHHHHRHPNQRFPQHPAQWNRGMHGTVFPSPPLPTAGPGNPRANAQQYGMSPFAPWSPRGPR